MRDWLVLGDDRAAPSQRDVLRAVSAETGVNLAAMLDRNARRAPSAARQLAMLVIRERCRARSYSQIARALQRQDHTTALHGCRAALRRLETDPGYRGIYEGVLARLNAAQPEAAE